MTLLFRIVWIGLLGALSSLPAGDDGFVLNTEATSLRLPNDRSMSVSGKGTVTMEDGHTVLGLPLGAFVACNGEPAQGELRVKAGDSVEIRTAAGGELVWTLEVGGPLAVGVPLDARSEELAFYRRALDLAAAEEGAVAVGHPAPVVIGVTTAPPDAGLAAQLGVSPEQTLRVVDVSKGLPAAASGVQPHDVIIAVNGHEIVTKDSLRDAIAENGPGEEVLLQLLRRGEVVTVGVPVITREEAERVVAGVSLPEEAQARELAVLEGALNEREAMVAHMRAVLMELDAERAMRERSIAELQLHLAQREARFADLRDMATLREQEQHVLRDRLAALQPAHPEYQELRVQLDVNSANLAETQARLAEEKVGLAAVRQELNAVMERWDEAAAVAADRKAEMEMIHRALRDLSDQRDAVAQQLAFVESARGSKALLIEDAKAAQAHAAEAAARAKMLYEQGIISQADVQREAAEAREAAAQVAVLVAEQREQAEVLRRELEVARREVEQVAAMEAERAARRAAELAAVEQRLAVENELAQREVEMERMHAELQRMQELRQIEALLADQQGSQQDRASASDARLASIEDRLVRIEQLLERLLASQPQ